MSAFKLDLDWEERLFTGLRSLLRIVRGTTPARPPRQAGTELPHLQLLARILSGRGVELVTSGHGGLLGEQLLVPAEELEADAAPALLQRVVLGSLMLAADRRIPQRSGSLTLHSLLCAEHACRQARRLFPVAWRTFRHLFQAQLAQRPALEGLPEQARPLERARRELLAAGCITHHIRQLHDDAASPPLPWGEFLAWPEAPLADAKEEALATATPDGTELDGMMSPELEFVQLRRSELEEQCLIHVFEKVETADDYSGGTRQLDGEDELEEQLEAIRELAMKHVLRGGDDTHAIYRAPMRMDVALPDVDDGEADEGLSYDEWDQRAGSYRKDWCRVYPEVPQARDPEWTRLQLQQHDGLIRSLEGRLRRLRLARSWQNRREDGHELDLEAAIQARIDLAAGRRPDERIYCQHLPRERNLAISVLLDCSLSVDGWVGERRILDLARESVLVLGEVCQRLQLPLSVCSFASRTRRNCRVWQLAGFEEAWRSARHRLGALVPVGYTRIGPALRHATRLLAARPERHRLLILLSDGKPNDYDRYEGRHGIADVRRAVAEGRDAGVETHALALGREASAWLPEMMGPGRWHTLQQPRDLLHGLVNLAGRFA